ncbi:MAG TPA: GNAT family N-acetyltransferase [Solirubrobacteraceae bacterium]
MAFDRVVQGRVATRAVPTRYGTAFFHDPTPSMWDRNLVYVDDVAQPFAALAADADEVQRALPHRMIVIDGDAGAHAADARAAGWLVERHVAMVARRPPDDPRPRQPVREVPGETLADARRRGFASEDWARRDPGAIEHVIALDARVREVIGERAFASFAAGEVAGVAYLYSDDDGIGQVEDVVTLPVHRGRGHARSVVLAAVAASRAAGHDVTFLWADENDWPKTLYAKLGFDVVGRRWRFRLAQKSRRPPA